MYLDIYKLPDGLLHLRGEINYTDCGQDINLTTERIRVGEPNGAPDPDIKDCCPKCFAFYLDYNKSVLRHT